MLFLPIATSPARNPRPSAQRRIPSRRERKMRKGAWLPDRAPFSCLLHRKTLARPSNDGP
jgi:hypothetical protein